jgi:hypothetical protein
MIDWVVYDWAPAVIGLVVATFFADYSLTHLGARLSDGARDRWSVEGSYEMNPAWEGQIDSGRWFGWRVLAVPALLAIALAAVRLLADFEGYWLVPGFFGLAAGTMLLLQAPVLMVHGANLLSFHDLADPTALEGGVRYSRWYVYRQAALLIGSFGVMWLVLWLPSQQLFFLGGAASCLTFAYRMARLGAAARRARATTGSPEVTAAPAETTGS